MTRIATELNRRLLSRRQLEREQLWWFREVHDLNPNITAYYASDLIANGSVIKRVNIEFGIEPGGKPEGLHILLFLTSRERFTIPEAALEEQIIWWTERDTDFGFYGMCDDCHQQWPLSKRIVGSNIRIGLVISNVTNKIMSARVGVLIQQP